MLSVTMPKILDGTVLKSKILADLTKKIDLLHIRYSKKPGLAVILVGDNPASKAYVGMKKKACNQIGINSYEHKLAVDVTENEILHSSKSFRF